MVFDGTDDRASSLQGLVDFLRGLQGAEPTPGNDPIAEAQADIARRARLPRGGGLFGGGYARFMADQAPPPYAPGWAGDLDPAVRLASYPMGQGGSTGGGIAPLADAGAQEFGAAGLPPDPQVGGRWGDPQHNLGLRLDGARIDSGQPATIDELAVNDPQSGGASAQAAPPHTQASAGMFATSPQGRAFIQRWELNSKTGQPYFDITPDDKHNPTFGYGHKVEAGEQAALQAKVKGLNRAGRAALIDQMFQKDLALAEQRVRDRLGPEAMKTLNQGQFDALVADAFNAGTAGALGPNMLRNIWDGDMAAAGKQFDAVTATDAKTGQVSVLRGLIRRSLQQAAIFNRGDYNYAPTDREIEAVRQAALTRAAARRITGKRTSTGPRR